MNANRNQTTSLGRLQDADAETGDDPGPQRDDPDHSIEMLDVTGTLSAARLAWLERAARSAMREAGAQGEMRVRLVGDREMAQVHAEHCAVEGTTDVITFDLRREARGALDTDLVVCVDEAARQAKARSIEIEKELLLYIVHGMLHCLGHDDHDDEAAKMMHEREDEILGAIDVGVVFGAPAIHDGSGGSARAESNGAAHRGGMEL